jgi:hypothetical protein
MGREPGNRFGVDIFAAPAVIGPRFLDQSRVAAWTAPTLRLLRALALCLLLHFGRVPFLHTVKMGHSPANRTGPHLGVPQHFVGADHTLVLVVVDILMNTGRKVFSRGFGQILGNRLLPLPLLRSRPNAIGAIVSVSAGSYNILRK